MSSDPATLLALAQNWASLNPMQLEVVAAYVCAVQAGGSTDPAVLLEAAKAFESLTPHQLDAVRTYQHAVICG